jgi:uncharacterized coiled-coil protein SlyX
MSHLQQFSTLEICIEKENLEERVNQQDALIQELRQQIADLQRQNGHQQNINIEIQAKQKA